MTRVVVAASIDNELMAKDIAEVRKLQNAGYEVQFFYYLPKIPAEFSMIPSFNSQIKQWRIHAKKILSELGNKLGLAVENRHFVDEVLGPNEVFNEAKEMHADIILTHNTELMKQRFLDRMFDSISSLFKGHKAKEVPVENVDTYVQKTLGEQRETKRIGEDLSAVNDERIQASLRSKKIHKL